MTDPVPLAPVPLAKWREILGNVAGHQIAGERRIATSELLELVGAENLGGKDRLTASLQLRSIMLALGWTGPGAMRIGSETVRGYHRPDPDCTLEGPPEQLPAPNDSAPAKNRAVTVTKDESPEELAHRLENVCHLSLDKIEEILKLPTDSKNGNVLRAQSAVTSSVIQAQIRVDESKLRTRQNSDVLDRLEKIMREVKKTLPKEKPRPQITGTAAES